ncbi:hypothetical protein D7Y24_14300 [Stenotrophomonas maltophilia]|uniref:hypothetical protein n=1 Tax=Stenotrophomonas TaxID=40323 RepID=UPI0008DE0539|nr:hypothetical protein [Stenotrophomonas maltophilia]HBP04000.1 hypothetical protein [Stenotrophomonas sp.]AVO31755.1 hypothetical protein C6Y55_18400 [Stenotrophomonas maltophilia]ELN2586313.1 hypothetical protein [Stenotrophomonas maltophilia]ELN2595249.1 hypothetical protein [Stenotrophomonas maltophilia]MBA0299579.1 hypothetical protein [Stenotrophomonas maltophilia]
MEGFEMLDKMEFHLGFHSAHPFWLGERIDIYDPEQNDCLRGIIPEVRASLQTDQFDAAICVNGLMLLHVHHLSRTTPDMSVAGDFDQSALWMDRHLDYANALQLCLESESIKHPDSYEVSATATRANDICKIGFLDGFPVNVSFGSARTLTTVMHAMSRWVSDGALAPSPLEAPGWRIPHEVVDVEVARLALQKFALIARDEHRVTWLSYLLKAKTAYSDNDYRMSFVLSWFVIESSLRWHWMMKNPGSAESPKTWKLIDNLCEGGPLSDQHKPALTYLRNLRNQLMHNPADTTCQPGQCFEAGEMACALALLSANVELVTSWQTKVQF